MHPLTIFYYCILYQFFMFLCYKNNIIISLALSFYCMSDSFLGKKNPKIGRLQVPRVLEDFKNTSATSTNV